MRWPVLLIVLCVVVDFRSVSVDGGLVHWWNRYWYWRFLHKPPIAISLAFEDCGTQYDVISINLSSCSTSPCAMKRSTNVTVKAEFSANGASTDGVLNHEAYFILNSVKTKATITPTTCDGNVCPRQGSYGLLFSADIYVQPSLPPMSGKLRWELRNSRGDSLLCYQLPVRID